MIDAKHWLDEASDADEFERSILRVGLSADPPHGAEDAVLKGVLGAVAVAPIAAAVAGGAQTAVGGASKALGVWLGVGKGFVVGLALYGAVAGANEVAARFSALPTPRASVAPKPAPRPPAAQAPLVTATPSETALDAPITAPSVSASIGARPPMALPSARPAAGEIDSIAAFPTLDSAPRPSQLQAEAAALREARGELRAGKLADAFATLEASRRKFSAPDLYQERESLMIELLSRSGQSALAKQRAEAFLMRFPDSPHTATIRQFASNESPARSIGR